jgi:hypothetical protein
VSITRTQIRQETAQLLAGPCVLESTASTNTTATLVILADYTSSLLQDGHFVGNVMYVSYDAAGAHGAPEGEWKRIQAYDASAGQFTLDAAFSAAVTAGDKVEIHTVTHPTLIHQAIDRSLRKMLYRTVALPSLAADADMEASAATGYSSSGASLAKNTTAANVFRGTTSLSVTDTGAGNGYGYQAFNVVEGDTYFVHAVCRTSAAATECQLQAYDATNSAEIGSETHDEVAWQSLAFEFTIPSGCKSLYIKLITVTASGVSYWDQLQLMRKKDRRYALPSWVTETWQVGRTVYQCEGTELVSDGRMVDESPPTRWDHIRVKKELGTVYIAPDPPFRNNAPVYIECLRAYSALATDAGTTDADLDWVATKAKYECLRMLAAPLVPVDERGEFRKALEEAKMEAAAMDARFMPKVEMPFGFGEESLWGLAEV